MANPIRRIIQLILDKRSAKQAEDDARKSVGAIEQAIGGLRRTLQNVGAALATAFGIRAGLRFLRESITEATTAREVWGRLGNTVRNAGGDFDALKGDLQALSKAFQEATIHTDEDYAESLDRLITLTGDVSASTRNMGLVANVASKFFNGELAPAVELVGKVMNGNTTLLQRMWIQVKTAQEGLAILAHRSFGDAARRAGEFGGKIVQLKNLWGEFKETLGDALINTKEAGGALDLLRRLVIALTDKVAENREEISGGFGKVLRGLIVVIDGVYRGLVGVVGILGGSLFFVVGALLTPLGLLAKGAGLVAEGGALIADRFGLKGAAGALRDFAKRVDDFRQGVRDLKGVGADMISEGVGRIGQRSQLAEDLLSDLANRKPGGKKKGTGLDTGGTMGKNAVDERLKDLATFERAVLPKMDAIAAAFEDVDRKTRLLGPSFDAVGAKAEILRGILATGLPEAARLTDDQLVSLWEQLGNLEADDRLRTFTENMADLQETLALTAVEPGADPVATRLANLANEAQVLEQAILAIPAALRATDPQYQHYAGRLRAIHAIIQQTTKAQQFQTQVANVFAEAIGAAMGAGLGPFAAGKAKQLGLEALEETIRGGLALLNPFTAASAGVHFHAAGEFAALAAGWAALAGAFGGFSGRGGASSGLAASRGASGGASTNAQQPTQEVHIHLDGPGFDALNPKVQKVVYGSMQEARKRFGNAIIRLHTSG